MPAPKGHKPYNTNGEGGRPVKYTEEFINLEADALREWMKKKENIFIEDFCDERDYHEEQIMIFCKSNERFSEAYKKFKNKQKSILMKGGLFKKFSYPMCQLLLGHSHGIIAKSEQKLSGDSVSPLAFLLQNADGKTKDIVHDIPD